jgi:hypothetical protein
VRLTRDSKLMEDSKLKLDDGAVYYLEGSTVIGSNEAL